jgi:hypothetical protein
LHDDHVFVFVHDEAAEKIALGVDHPEARRVRQVFLPHGQCGADAFLEKGLVREMRSGESIRTLILDLEL